MRTLLLLDRRHNEQSKICDHVKALWVALTPLRTLCVLLLSLSLSHSMMNDRHVRRLASKLLDDECLKHLDLSHNEIGDK